MYPSNVGLACGSRLSRLWNLAEQRIVSEQRRSGLSGCRDLSYPKCEGEIDFTAGAIALLIEAALARRLPSCGLAIDQLGKPKPCLFTAASGYLGIAPHRLVMLGDQIETDVVGARAAGVDAALLAGISSWDQARAVATVAPQWLLDTLFP